MGNEIQMILAGFISEEAAHSLADWFDAACSEATERAANLGLTNDAAAKFITDRLSLPRWDDASGVTAVIDWAWGDDAVRAIVAQNNGDTDALLPWARAMVARWAEMANTFANAA